MSGWNHRHILDLAAFSWQDYAAVLELAQRFRSLPVTGQQGHRSVVALHETRSDDADHPVMPVALSQ